MRGVGRVGCQGCAISCTEYGGGRVDARVLLCKQVATGRRSSNCPGEKRIDRLNADEAHGFPGGGCQVQVVLVVAVVVVVVEVGKLGRCASGRTKDVQRRWGSTQ